MPSKFFERIFAVFINFTAKLFRNITCFLQNVKKLTYHGETSPNFSSMAWEEIGCVESLHIYPCKSARGVQLEEALATPYGLADGYMQDRSFLVVTSEGGTMVTGRKSGKLMTIMTSYDENYLTMTTHDGDSIHVNIKDDIRHDYVIESRIWRQKVRGVDCGDEVAEWLSKTLFDNKTLVRLIYSCHGNWDRSANKPKYFEFTRFKESDKLYFADTSAYMIANLATLADLNLRSSETIPMENFRPNIVVKGPPAFQEDEWEFVKIGEAIFRVTKPCERCVVTCISPKDGERKKEPIQTLLKYRKVEKPEALSKVWSRSPIFGVNCGIDNGGAIKVYDKVYVVKNKNRWKISTD